MVAMHVKGNIGVNLNEGLISTPIAECQSYSVVTVVRQQWDG